MKILPEQEATLREAIRDALALDPLITIRRLQRVVESKTRRTISDKYLMRLLQKVRREVVIYSDRKKVSTRLIEVQERYATLIKQLLCIAYWLPEYHPKYGISRPKASERINAIRTIAQMDLALLRAELDVGVYEDRRAALAEMLREGLLPHELHEQVIGVFRTHRVNSAQMPVKTHFAEAVGSFNYKKAPHQRS